ncbi:MAG: iron-sulfur cluster insertion protein ErpA [Chloroflexi bacterium]|nr:iron-sulfur cluster insertion protein ErpA [Chloroflexota bacterium]
MPTMTVLEKIDTDTIEITGAAANKVRGILQERNLLDHGLRVFVSGGGCSGMQYGMAIEGTPREFDNVVEAEGVKLYIDPTSMMYLAGAHIDYVDNLMGGGFRIDNPNAVSTCGCGHSFRTSDAEGRAGGSSDGGGACGCQ